MNKTKEKRLKITQHASRLFSGELQECDEVQSGDGWSSYDKEYQKEYKNLSYMLANMEDLKDDPMINEWKNEEVTIPVWERIRENPVSLFMISTAAVFLLIFTLFFFQGRHEEQLLAEETILDKQLLNISQYYTETGESKKIYLDDGSIVTLNSGSLIAVDFDIFRRHINLVRGEAFFEVAHDKERPFTVNLGARSVTALGTKFNIRKSPNTFVLAVTEGKVAIHLEGQHLQSKPFPLENTQGDSIQFKPLENYEIEAGTIAKFDAMKNTLTGFSPEKIEKYQEWRTGKIVIDKEPLYRVIEELNRYSKKKIVIKDTSIMYLKMDGVINIDKLHITFSGMEKILPIKVIHDFDKIEIIHFQEE